MASKGSVSFTPWLPQRKMGKKSAFNHWIQRWKAPTVVFAHTTWDGWHSDTLEQPVPGFKLSSPPSRWLFPSATHSSYPGVEVTNTPVRLPHLICIQLLVSLLLKYLAPQKAASACNGNACVCRPCQHTQVCCWVFHSKLEHPAMFFVPPPLKAKAH